MSILQSTDNLTIEVTEIIRPLLNDPDGDKITESYVRPFLYLVVRAHPEFNTDQYALSVCSLVCASINQIDAAEFWRKAVA
jgi:hypothetical protein